MKVRGGKAVYGATIGILMLEARFPRIPGDMGNALSWPFPVLYKVVRGASPDLVVRRRGAGLLPAFVDAAGELVAQGADAITTNCGFMSLFQADIATAVGVPVATSSLMQVPMVQAVLPPGKRVGILTICAAALSHEHLAGAGVDPATPIVGTDTLTGNGREFTRVILDDAIELDTARAERDILDAGGELVRDHPGIGAIVLECTNMTPYARALRARLGLPVYSMQTLVEWLHGALLPRHFAPEIVDTRPGPY
ncbi:MAG: aspartate/glutamate racemase family protein [Hyphomicrobiales bacterium]